MDILRIVLFGQSSDLTVLAMSIRAVIVYVCTIIMVRVGKKRFIGTNTAFDLVLGIILGSVASRAITGNAPFIPALASVGTLVASHWFLGAIAVRSDTFRKFVEGETRQLIEDGKPLKKNMNRSHVTMEDVYAAMRRNHLERIEDVKKATLERSGKITVLPQTSSSWQRQE